MLIPPPGSRCLLGVLKSFVGDSDPPLSPRVDESKEREGVYEMPNIGLKGGVDVLEPVNHRLLLQPLLLIQVLNGMHVAASS
jgi:hypothetical protein